MMAARRPPLRMGRPRSFQRALFLLVALALCLLPVLWTLLASFGSMPENVSTNPTLWVLRPTLESYHEIGVQDPRFVLKLLTSVAIAALTTALTLSISVPAAFAISRSRFRGKDLLVQCLLVLACLPVVSFIMPLRNFLNAVRLYDTFSGTLLAETALYAPLAAYVLYGYVNRVSREQEESAQIDGAGIFQILLRVVLPASAPGVTSTAIILFVLSWNQVLVPLILSMPVNTVPVSMIDFFIYERELEWPVAAAAVAVSFTPIIVFTAASHRFIERFRFGCVGETE